MNQPEHLTKEQQQDQGAFYTPPELAREMAEKLNWLPGQRILDPCVGYGNLLQACKEVYPELTNDLLYGLDIDPIAVEKCKQRFPGGHFVCADCLKVNVSSDKLWNDTERYLQRLKPLFE